jgi:hypothetical protein
MVYVEYAVGSALIVVPSGVWLYLKLSGMQAELRGLVAQLRSQGVDPDTAFLGAIARIQAEDRHRWRSPVRWVGMKYVQLSRRRFTA